MINRNEARASRWPLSRGSRRALAASLGLAFAVPTAAQEPPMTPLTPLARPMAEPPLNAAARPEESQEKTVSFVFDEKPWKSVLDWFAKESGLVLHVTGSTMPMGSLTIKTDPSRKYTLSQVVDLLNESLAPQNLIILRRSQTFTVLPADLKIPKDLVPKIAPEELVKRGDTEMVEVTHTLKAIPADEILTQLQKLKGPFGEINSLGSNTLIIQDTARNVRLIIRYLEQVEDDKQAGDQWSYQCEYIRVTVAADQLKKLLSDATTRVENEVPGQPQWGGNNWGGGGGWQQDWNRGGGRDERGRGGNQPAPAMGGRFKTVQIATVETTNTLLITGPADKIAAAKKILKEIDTAPLGTPKRVIGPAEFRNFPVPAGSAENMAKMLSEDYKTSSVVRILPAANKNEITVYAPPADMIDIMQKLRSIAEAKPSTVVEVILISNFREPKDVADALKRIHPDSGNGPFIDPRTDPTPGIIVRGTQAQIDDVRASYRTTFEDFGSAPGAPRPTSRILSVETGNAGVIADALADMIRGTRSNPVDVKGGHSTQPPPAPAPSAAPPGPGTQEPGPTSMNYRRGSSVRQVSAQIVDPQAPAQPPVDPNKKPLTITVVGGKIVIASDDPELLEYASQMARLIIRESNTVVDSLFEIIPLSNCSAEEAAKTINELFNGPQQPAQGQGGGGRGGGGLGGLGGGLGMLAQFAGIGGAAPSAPAPGRIRVVADKQSNSLIVVKASPADLALIRVLLEKAINKEQDVTAATYPKTHIIRLNNARADEVKATLSEVYANLMTSRGGGGRQQMPFPFPFPQQQQQAATPPQLTISVDERSNSLIVNCNDILHSEIVKLVTMIDESAEDLNEVVQVIKLNGIDPAMVDALIAAMNGQQPTSQVRPGSQQGGGFGGGMGGFPGMGGGMGGFPGMGGGGNRGGMQGGFGGNRGGGGFPGMGGGGNRGGMQGGGGNRGGGNRGGGRNRAPDYFHDGGGGPDFFDYRDKEVPSGASMIYDPETDPTPAHALTQVRYQEPAIAIPQVQPPVPQPQPQPMPQPPGTQPPAQPGQPGAQPPSVLPAPNDPVFGAQVPGTDAYVLRGRNQADLNQVLRAIEFLRATEAQQAQIKIQLVPMKNQDASAVVNILNTLFSRVQISGGATTLAAQPTRFGLGGGGGLAALFGGGGLGGGGAQPIGSIFMLPLPRFNSILLAVPESRLADVMDKINLLDVPNGDVMSPVAFPLKNQSAQNVSQQIQTFFNARYTGETQQQNQIRVFFDANQNTVYVQASPADLKDVADIIRALDSGEHGSLNELRVFPLNHAFAQDLASVLFASLTSNAVNPSLSANAAGAAGGVGQLGGQAGLGAFGGGANLGGLLGGQQPGGFGGGLGGGLGGQVNFPTAGIATRTAAVRLFSRDGQFVDSGYLVDVHIIPDARINSLVISAPAQTMRLIEKLIFELDIQSAAAADVKVFTLKKADATTTAQLLLQLFSRVQQAGGLGGLGGGLGGFGGQLGGQLGATAQPRPFPTLTGEISEGANLVDIRLAVDVRTNSMIVVGSPSDMDTIRAIVARLEDAEASQLLTKVYKLRNNGAADVQAAVLAFMQQKLQAEGQQFQSIFQTLQQSIFIQAEPITNTLLLAVAPKYFHEVVGLIEKLDSPPTQVFVQVLIAEVQLRNTEELGVEFGIQSPVLFARSQTGGTAGTPGFNFNSTAIPPMPTVADPGVVGFQGLGNLGVGRSGATGVGGFVFSAASDTFSLLVRALKAQSRIDVLSKPQLLLTDGQVGFFQVGQSFPINLGTTQSPNVGITANIQYIDIGITLRVTPRINPDGRVLMRVEPQITNPVPTPINLGNGVLATAFDTESLQTTVLASDGETVVLGGLIRRSDQKTENKIPVLGDIPYVGAAFRYRTQAKERREVLFIITPHIVRSEADMARVGSVETCKMNWVYNDVMDVNTYGAALLNGQNPYEAGWETSAYALPPGASQPPLPGGVLPDQGITPGTPTPFPQPLPGGIVPDSTIMPGQPVSSSSEFSSLRSMPTVPTVPMALPRTVIQPAAGRQPGTPAPPQQQQQGNSPAMPADKPREGNQWSVFGR